MPSAGEVRALFRTLLRHGRQFPNYNVREYILRSSRDQFRSGAGLKDAAEAEKAFLRGKAELEVVKRQSQVYQLYARNIKNVMELKPASS